MIALLSDDCNLLLFCCYHYVFIFTNKSLNLNMNQYHWSLVGFKVFSITLLELFFRSLLLLFYFLLFTWLYFPLDIELLYA